MAREPLSPGLSWIESTLFCARICAISDRRPASKTPRASAALALGLAVPTTRLWNSRPFAQRPWLAFETFQHELIDLARKPPEFLELHASVKPGETAKVPLELDGRVIVESVDVARAVCDGTPLYPPGEAACIDDFVAHWSTVERAYYAVLSASSEHAVAVRRRRSSSR